MNKYIAFTGRRSMKTFLTTMFANWTDVPMLVLCHSKESAEQLQSKIVNPLVTLQYRNKETKEWEKIQIKCQ